MPSYAIILTLATWNGDFLACYKKWRFWGKSLATRAISHLATLMIWDNFNLHKCTLIMFNRPLCCVFRQKIYKTLFHHLQVFWFWKKHWNKIWCKLVQISYKERILPNLLTDMLFQNSYLIYSCCLLVSYTCLKSYSNFETAIAFSTFHSFKSILWHIEILTVLVIFSFQVTPQNLNDIWRYSRVIDLDCTNANNFVYYEVCINHRNIFYNLMWYPIYTSAPLCDNYSQINQKLNSTN